MDEKKILEGIRVIDFATYIAAPVCACMLADLGAEVIKVEPPDGDPLRTFCWPEGKGNVRFDMISSGKKSVVIDIRTPEGLSALKKLIDSADVFISNTRKKSLEKYGLDYDNVSVSNPGLVYAWLSGYGDKGPKCDMPAFDSSSFWSESGLALDTTVARDDFIPSNNPNSGGDRVTGLMLFSLVMTALYRKLCTGKGDYVTASLLHAGMYQNAFSYLSAQDGHKFPSSRLNGSPASAPYLCADGRWLRVAVVTYPRMGRNLWRALGMEESYFKPEYAYPEAYSAHKAEIFGIFEREFAKRPADEWMDILRENDVPATILVSSNTVQDDEQIIANGYLEKYTTSLGKEYDVLSSPLKLRSQPLPHIHDVPEKLGADTYDVFRALGLCDDNIRTASGGLLPE